MLFKDRPFPRVILLQNDGGVAAPLGKLTALLTQAIAAKHKDRILVMHIVATAPADPGFALPKEVLGVDQVWVVTGGASAKAAVAATLAKYRTVYSAIYLDPFDGGPPFADLEDLIELLVLVIKDRKKCFEPSPKYSILISELLQGPPEPPREAGSFSAKMDAFKNQRLEDVMTLGAETGKCMELPTKPVQPEWFRIRLDMDAITALADPDFNALPEETRTRFARWGRAVTNRRVGLALGGSGAWSYAHVDFILGLLNRGIPIDMISGASGGTFVGAYYAAQGTIGLGVYVSRALTLQLLLVPAFFTMAVIEWLFDYDLGLINLDDLEIPLYPVATNLTAGKEDVIVGTSVGWGARASASAPGIFASTIVNKTIYVDGAVTDNVPATVVADMGAELVIASNAMPAPNSRQPRWQPDSVIGRVIQQLNPLGRIFDTVTSASLMFHDSGNYQARAADAQVLYEPTPKWFPISRAFLFILAHEVMRSASTERPFIEALDKAEKAWNDLSQPMAPPPRPLPIVP
jgi:NTE family protein